MRSRAAAIFQFDAATIDPWIALRHRPSSPPVLHCAALSRPGELALTCVVPLTLWGQWLRFPEYVGGDHFLAAGSAGLFSGGLLAEQRTDPVWGGLALITTLRR